MYCLNNYRNILLLSVICLKVLIIYGGAMKGNQTVLVTGAAGNIGTKLRPHLEERYQLRLLDMDSRGDKSIIKVDLSKWSDELLKAFEGVDAVIHLAPDPDESKSWEDLVSPNLDAAINPFIAAGRARVKRFIYASSNHAMGGYKDKAEIKCLTTKMPPLPGTHFSVRGTERDSTPYGSMKLFGERLGKCYAEATDMSVIAVRIGWVQRGDNRVEDLPADSIEWYKRMWLSTRDLCQLIEKCIEAKLSQPFVIVNGMSNNADMIWDIEHTREVLGYEPQDGRQTLASRVV